MDKSFGWVKKIINSINSPLQIECCENLISLFEKKYYSEDFNSDEENEFNSLISVLNHNLEIKKNKYLN
jgi:hypothetical protein